MHSHRAPNARAQASHSLPFRSTRWQRSGRSELFDARGNIIYRVDNSLKSGTLFLDDRLEEAHALALIGGDPRIVRVIEQQADESLRGVEPSPQIVVLAILALEKRLKMMEAAPFQLL